MKIKIDISQKINEEYISVKFGCITFTDSYRFLSSCLDELIKTLDYDVFEILKTKFPDQWLCLKKLAYPYENFNSIDGSQKPVINLKKKFSSKN